MKATLTQDRLKERLRYDATTGEFFWLPLPAGTRYNNMFNTKLAGTRAGYSNNLNYIKIGFDGAVYGAHRLAWLYVYGEHPKDCIDHINNDPSDNRIENLREATKGENTRNRKWNKGRTLPKGVSQPHGGKYRARIYVNRTYHDLGLHSTVEQASAAYWKAAQELHGIYANSGFLQTS